MNPLLELIEHGQSYWLDNLTRRMIRSGELERRVREEGLRGVTSNPAIFQKAISGGGEYDERIEELVAEHRSVAEIYEDLTVTDIQGACDVLRPVWEDSDGVDGYVSLEVSPYLARDTEGSVAEARTLYERVQRPNVMIKIPGTREGLPAIEELLFQGVNVNVTLLFSVPRYEAVARAYLQALHRRRDAGKPLGEVASVASFFLSRIDVLVDRLLGDRIREGTAGAGAEVGAPDPRELLGKTAIANAKRAYGSFRTIFSGERWEGLEAEGARVQRVLWASTSTKDPLYRDVRYAEELIGPDTVNTLPDATIEAFADHGRVETTVTDDLEEAEAVLQGVEERGIDLEAVTAQLEDEGIRKFVDPFDTLMGTLARRRRAFLGLEGCEERYAWGEAAGEVDAVLASLRLRRGPRRFWAKDPSLWGREGSPGPEGIGEWMGWLESPEAFTDGVEELEAFAEEIRGDGFRHVVLLGMGGSSLSAEVSRKVFGVAEGHPDLRILDATDPGALGEVEEEIDLERTLFLVGSKSGTTAETLSFFRHFWALLEEGAGNREKETGDHFVAITDPGTPLVAEAREKGFRRTFENPEEIGGRYSVLSWFGLVPMALIGVDVEAVLGSARQMKGSCGPFVPPAENPGFLLGAALGRLAREGRNKVTVLASEGTEPFGAWLEQLLAESTGKGGEGLVPVVEEPLGEPDAYGPDRIFVGLRFADEEEGEAGARLDALEERGHPVVRFAPRCPEALGGEFFRWEVATAVAGAVLGLNPFDQPNVEEAKHATRTLLAGGGGPGAEGPEPQIRDGGLALALAGAASGLVDGGGGAGTGGGTARSLEAAAALRRFLGLAREGDYLSLQAFLHRTPERHRALQELRRRIRDRLGVATTLGYGPRYLHSTGQLHKGGPDQGLHLILTREPEENPRIPGEEHGFADLLRAQALGDLRALEDRGRRVAWLHVSEGTLEEAVERLADGLQP